MPMLTSMSSVMPVDHERLVEHDSDAYGGGLAGRWIGGGEQDGELVAAEPGHGVVAADRALEPPGHLDQQQVARVVAEVVVDLLEPVEVEHQHGGPAGAGPRRGQGRLGPCLEGGPIRQPGERVVRGHAFDHQAVRPIGPSDHPEDDQPENEREQRAQLQQGGVVLRLRQAGCVPPDLALLLAAQHGEQPV
jgi:hypothetical protein